ncbi:MAG: DivIVA domain-containing protein [Lachnospiraceae bacterium]|nr:DivIVA domain-containing protein [Lachnospiraceae bacterium]
MLTPVEIQNKSFKSGGLGYDKKEVESYMKEIVRSYEEVYRENMELKDKVGVLNEGIQYYKSIEKTLQKALLLAEKTAENTKAAALKDAKRIEKEATTKANIMLADARNELETLHHQTIALIQQYEKYKAQFKNLARANIELIESDAFNINVSSLDAFINDPDALKPIKPSSADNNDSNSDSASDGGHLSDIVDDNEEYDFSDYQLEGQEEFDFVDINDNE